MSPLVVLPPPQGFWDISISFPNQSLWNAFTCTGDGSSITRGLIVNTLIMWYDGSYMVYLDETLCSIVSTRCAAERSDEVDNYCGEILRILMLQHIFHTKRPLFSVTTKVLFSMAINRGPISPKSKLRQTVYSASNSMSMRTLCKLSSYGWKLIRMTRLP